MKVVDTLRSMLKKRGYEIQSDDVRDDLQRRCNSIIASPADIIVGKNADNGKIIAIALSATQCPKLTVKIVRELKQWCADTGIYAVVASAKPPTPSAKDEAASPDSRIQTFMFQQLKVDITTHRLVPKHTKLDEPDAVKILSSMFIKRNQLPKLLTSDAVCRFYNFQPGSVIKIDRNNGHMQETVVYRLVVQSS